MIPPECTASGMGTNQRSNGTVYLQRSKSQNGTSSATSRTVVSTISKEVTSEPAVATVNGGSNGVKGHQQANGKSNGKANGIRPSTTTIRSNKNANGKSK